MWTRGQAAQRLVAQCRHAAARLGVCLCFHHCNRRRLSSVEVRMMLVQK